MKRWIWKSVTWVIVILLLGACVIEHEERNSSNYNGGERAFDVYEDNMKVLTSFLDLAIRMEHYLAVPEDERFDAEQKYFPEYKIRSVGEEEWVGLRARDTAFRIVTGGRSLGTEGAEWKVCKYEGVFFPSWVTLTYNETKNITLTVGGCEAWNWTIDAALQFQSEDEELPVNYYIGGWAIHGNGKCVSEKDQHEQPRILLDFEITQPLVKLAGADDVANEGEVALLVRDTYLQQEEKVKATIESLAGDGRWVNILYKGKEYRH